MPTLDTTVVTEHHIDIPSSWRTKEEAHNRIKSQEQLYYQPPTPYAFTLFKYFANSVTLVLHPAEVCCLSSLNIPTTIAVLLAAIQHPPFI
jgi:hypothetical protein